MSERLHQYLVDAYERSGQTSQRGLKRGSAIQIDDQDDNDVLTEFCTIFVSVQKNNRLEVELAGAIPITAEIADLIEIYDGFVELHVPGRIVFSITPAQLDVVVDLAARIRKTCELGYTVNNPNWFRIASRTTSSLQRFVRIIKEYQKLKGQMTV